ncbi:homocysteine S-methyltransferase family protein [Aspergillus candidus]|uniref:Putative homocysteine S-methyltransferase n=1 Tax=Aspergillus candidus TaxID=41067 RepID=A0A2I2F8D8_ASPCN|nr:putative homocysteine S-methyltransferase [Aspergillus candidus]PLB36881.1 putative homocysteine S-methyltransferase [Aspergillus candidus]
MSLPHLKSSLERPFLSEPGMETTLYYKHQIALPSFSSLPLLTNPTHRALISSLYANYISIAAAHNTGIILDTRTWRASTPWASALNMTPAELLAANRDAVQLAKAARTHSRATSTNVPVLISGTMGPLQDAYEDSSQAISLDTARDAYRPQVQTLADAGVDLLGLFTISNLNEAIAIIELAREVGLPIVVSFSIGTDGRLLGGNSLEDAIRAVDEATGGYAAYFGVNCAHPARIAAALREMSSEVRARIGMVRGNASQKTHDELDNTDTLDRGHIPTYLDGFRDALALLPAVKVVGGCCGTDEEHLGAIGGGLL